MGKFDQFLKYRIPKRKMSLITDAFLETLKEELDRIFELDKRDKKPTYWNAYAYIDSTNGYSEALKITSEKHNVKRAIYEYQQRLPWYHSDLFDSELIALLYKRGIIEEGEVDALDYPTKEELDEMEKNGEIEWFEEVRYYKDYHVTNRDWRFVEKQKT